SKTSEMCALCFALSWTDSGVVIAGQYCNARAISFHLENCGRSSLSTVVHEGLFAQRVVQNFCTTLSFSLPHGTPLTSSRSPPSLTTHPHRSPLTARPPLASLLSCSLLADSRSESYTEPRRARRFHGGVSPRSISVPSWD